MGKKIQWNKRFSCHSWGFGEAGAGRPGVPGGRSHLLCPGALTVVTWVPAVVGGSCRAYSCRMQFVVSSSGTLWRVGATNNRACPGGGLSRFPLGKGWTFLSALMKHRRTEEKEMNRKGQAPTGWCEPKDLAPAFLRSIEKGYLLEKGFDSPNRRRTEWTEGNKAGPGLGLRANSHLLLLIFSSRFKTKWNWFSVYCKSSFYSVKFPKGQGSFIS